MASKFGLAITGSVLWGDAPAPAVRVVLTTSAEFDQRGILAETLSRADGWFEFQRPPVGEWYVFAMPPADEFHGWIGRPVSVQAGEWVNGGPLGIWKYLTLIEPAPFGRVPAPAPVLRWAAYPGVSRYHVDIFDNITREAVLRQDTTGTHLVVDPPLAMGREYDWSVLGLDDHNQTLAGSLSWVFAVAG